MTELHTRILAAIAPGERLTTAGIAERAGATPEATQAALHALDDTGHVLMRCGCYSLSAAAVRAREGEAE